MKRILLVALCAVGIVEVSAQQDPQFTQNMFNRLATNPGYAGAKDVSLCATLISREQWLGFEGNPRTNVFSAHKGFVVRQKHQMGGGLTIIQDEIGPINSLNIKGALSYHYRISQGILSGGIEFGIFNQSINGEWRAPEGNLDGTDDPSIPNSEAGATKLDLGFGLYYYTKDLYVGLSSTHLNQPLIEESLGDNSSLTFQQVRHYYVTAGYNYPLDIGSASLELQPSIFAKTDAVSTVVDINTNVLYNNLLWAGVSYRTQDAVSFLAGVKFETIVKYPELKPLSIGFAYDYNLSDLSDYNDGSLEFMINYCYKFIKPVKLERYKDVRFL